MTMAAQAQLDSAVLQRGELPAGDPATWTGRATLLWNRRGLLLRLTAISLAVNIGIVVLIPKQYESGARIMPPDQAATGASLLGLMASRSAALSPLSTLASGLIGARTTTALFISLLQSGTIAGHLVDRFQLQAVYGKRYRIDAAKRLARNTQISDDKKSGVITIQVTDRDPRRARDLAQAYLDELNNLVRQTSNSAARQERIFLEQRLRTATEDLEHAQTALSDYSTQNNTIDLKEQTRAMVDAAARIEGELVLEQSTLNSLRQVYGDDNVRVREAQARAAVLQHELRTMSGSSNAVNTADGSSAMDMAKPYPALRQLPRLAVRYADLYRTVRVEETVFELLTQQYESARIEEAKDIPAVNVIDAPGIPEKKSFPPRTLLALALTLLTTSVAASWILLSAKWGELSPNDERTLLIRDIVRSFRSRTSLLARRIGL